jgi:hypothetical protein
MKTTIQKSDSNLLVIRQFPNEFSTHTIAIWSDRTEFITQDGESTLYLHRAGHLISILYLDRPLQPAEIALGLIDLNEEPEKNTA